MTRPPAHLVTDSPSASLLALIERLGDRRIETRTLMRDAARALRLHLGLEVAFVSRIQAAVRKLIAVDVRPGSEEVATATRIWPGREDPIDDTFCHRILIGELPPVMENAMDNPVVSAMLTPKSVRIGGYVNVPVRAGDGGLFGTICCFSAEAEPGLGRRDVEVMNLVAELLGRRLDRDALAAREDRDFRRRITRTIEEGRLSFVRQPIVDIRAERTIGYELLCRFDMLDATPPDEALRRARELGLGAQVERAILRGAVEWSRKEPDKSFDLFVNLSPSLVTDRECREILAEIEHPLVVEMTETTAYILDDPTLSTLGELRGSGVRLAVDDFGVGFGNLEALARIRPDFIKLAGPLTRRLGHDPAIMAVVVGLVAFAKATGARLLAEGVETEPEAKTAAELGIELAQGWAFGRPRA